MGQRESSTLAPHPNDLKDLHRLPGYGGGFVTTEKLSEAVAVLGPLLKALGPHLGRDPVMFARVRGGPYLFPVAWDKNHSIRSHPRRCSRGEMERSFDRVEMNALEQLACCHHGVQ